MDNQEPKNTQNFEGCIEPEHGKPPPSHPRFFLIATTLILILGLFLFGFFPRYFLTKDLNEAAKEQIEPVVRVLKVKHDTHKNDLILPSSTDAINITPIWARTNGYLSNFLVDIGDHVKEGQLLATIDTPEVDQQLDQAKADLVSAIAKRDIARISAERWQELFKHNPEALSKQEVDERNATYASTNADVASAQHNVDRLQKLQGFKNIIAPFDGTIIERDIDIGSLISAGSNGNPQQLFKIAKTDVIRVFVNVPQAYFRSIQYGMPVEVKVREFKDKVFKGTVVRTAKALDPIARTLMTQVNIDNKSGELFPGLYAEVRFVMNADKKSFIIPTEALIIRTGNPQVAILDPNNTVQLKTVTIGRDMGSQLQIIDGLNDNDTIIINPNEKIRNGVHVQILDPSSKN